MLGKSKWRLAAVESAQKVNEVRVRSEERRQQRSFTEEEALYTPGATVMAPLRSHYQAY